MCQELRLAATATPFATRTPLSCVEVNHFFHTFRFCACISACTATLGFTVAWTIFSTMAFFYTSTSASLNLYTIGTPLFACTLFPAFTALLSFTPTSIFSGYAFLVSWPISAPWWSSPLVPWPTPENEIRINLHKMIQYFLVKSVFEIINYIKFRTTIWIEFEFLVAFSSVFPFERQILLS